MPDPLSPRPRRPSLRRRAPEPVAPEPAATAGFDPAGFDPADASPASLVAFLDRLAAERDALAAQLAPVALERDAALAKADDYLAALQRERAEFTNFRRRTAEERERDLGLAGVDLITKVLALADDFDRAIETRPPELEGNAWVEGIAAIDRKLRLLLESEGVTALDAVPGAAFDPRVHEAIASVPGTGLPEGAIAAEIRRGYRLRDRVIRPALVAVAAGAQGDVPEPIN